MLTPMNRAGGLPANLKLRGDSNPHGSIHHLLDQRLVLVMNLLPKSIPLKMPQTPSLAFIPELLDSAESTETINPMTHLKEIYIRFIRR
jgi:hypothetical protein